MTVNKLYTSLPANHITAKQTNHVQQTRLYNIIDWQLLFTWLWRWLPHRQSKRQSPTTVLFRTSLTRTITLRELILKLIVWWQNVQNFLTYLEMASGFTCTLDWCYNFQIFKATVSLKFSQLCLILRNPWKKRQPKDEFETEGYSKPSIVNVQLCPAVRLLIPTNWWSIYGLLCDSSSLSSDHSSITLDRIPPQK